MVSGQGILEYPLNLRSYETIFSTAEIHLGLGWNEFCTSNLLQHSYVMSKDRKLRVVINIGKFFQDRFIFWGQNETMTLELVPIFYKKYQRIFL